MELIGPEVIVALGATAGKALLGSSFRVTKERGTRLEGDASGPARGALIVPTIHPSAVLRADDREAVYEGLVADLRVAAEVLG
ncbi:Type-4 uracil-DNA glycosylase OS=Streptomyces antimycoticus OX=68175 GN=SSPO_046180 PE=3 SV=1 [Streptomyces antimycoticus]